MSKDGNPKDALGVTKWRTFSTIPMTVLCEVGAAFTEGAHKYGRHNYRYAGATASIYIDGAIGHIMQWWEGEDNDPVTTISHLSKAIANLVIIRDSMIQGTLKDDRPPKANLDPFRSELQASVDHIMKQWPDPVAPYTEQNQNLRGVTKVVIADTDALNKILNALDYENENTRAVLSDISKLGKFQHVKTFPNGGVVGQGDGPAFVVGERPDDTVLTKEFDIPTERRLVFEKAMGRAKSAIDTLAITRPKPSGD